MESLGLAGNPSMDPTSYPGATVSGNCLLADGWLYFLQPEAGLPAGEWAVSLDGGPIVDHLDGNPSLDEALGKLGQAASHRRHPLLAVGSNASPGQLRHKLAGHAADVVPVTRAAVRGITIGHAAVVSVPGYIPYAPATGPAGDARTLSVLWLDDLQLARVTATEQNYHPAILAGGAHPAVLDSGQRLTTYTLYRSRWGLLRPAPGQPLIPATTQGALHQILATFPWFTDLVPEHRAGAAAAAAALASDPDRRIRVRNAFAREHIIGPDGLQLYDQ